MTRRAPRILFELYVLALFTLIPANVHAQTVAEVFEIYYGRAEELEGAVRMMLSDQGKLSVNKSANMIIVSDRPEVIARIRELLTKLDRKPKNIDIAVEFVEKDNFSKAGVDIRWRAGGAGWSIATIPAPRGGTGVELGIKALSSKLKAVKRQYLRLLERSYGKIFVGESVPFEEYFFQYGVNHGFIGKTTTFHDAGTSFSVTAVTLPQGRIKVELAPEVSYYDRKKGSFTVKNAATTVIMNDPGVMVIGAQKGEQNSFEGVFMSGASKGGSVSDLLMILSVKSDD